MALAVAHLPGDEPAPPDWSLRGEALAAMLGGLARQQGMDPEDFAAFRSERAFSKCWGKGDVVTVPVGGREYVVAVQSVEAVSVPGTSAQQVVLLTPQGKILDRIQCHINSRYGRTDTSVSRPHPDTAEIVISFQEGGRASARSWWHNWHTLSFRGRFHTYWEEETGRPNEWDGRGLCRAEIVDGKFAVTFPRLERPEEELARATSLRIGYFVGNELRHLEVADAKQIEAVLSAMDVRGTEQGVRNPPPANARIDVRLPHGRTTRLTFFGPTFLQRRDWGRIHLASTAFHDRVAELVAKAEGTAVDLVPASRK